MVHSLTWQSTEIKQFGGCVFFKSNNITTKGDFKSIDYEINVDPELPEYKLFIFFDGDSWQAIGKFPTFESACLAANEHYQYLELNTPS